MKHIKAFLKGVREFLQEETTHYPSDLIESYDQGRDMAHRMTLRYFDY